MSSVPVRHLCDVKRQEMVLVNNFLKGPTSGGRMRRVPIRAMCIRIAVQKIRKLELGEKMIKVGNCGLGGRRNIQ